MTVASSAIGLGARSMGHRALILVTSYPGQPSCAEFARQAAAGIRPRKDYVELARLLDADVVDDAYLESRATPLARIMRRVAGRPAAQVVEAFLRGSGYDHVFAWPGRDYKTLLAAVRHLDIELRIAVGKNDVADSALERRLRASVPTNTTIQHLAPLELRDLYSSARFVVMPLEDVESDAGVTALTEAMAMGKAVIVTRTRGQIDVIEDGEQGIYVPPRDPRALRTAIEYLSAHPEEAERMGRAGRALVEERHTLTRYVERLAGIVRGEQVPASRICRHTTSPSSPG